MGRKQENYIFVSIAVLGNISELDSLQAFISQRGRLTIYIQTFGGPSKVSSMGGTTYMLTIIDDFSCVFNIQGLEDND